MAELPGTRLDLRAWARTYDFASRVLDPHRVTVLGFLRLAIQSTHRADDTVRAEGRTVEKKSLWTRLKWIYAM